MDYYTVIVDRDEELLQHKVNDVMKKLEYWFRKIYLMINNGKTVAISYYT